MSYESPLHVLLVDDEPDVIELLAYALRNESYIFRTAGSGHEALTIFEEEAVDILVTDIKMPRMDGLELIARVRALKSDTQVIVISAHGDVDIAVQAMKEGAVDFLQKPINHKVLKMAIDSAAEKWHLRHTLDLTNQTLLKEIEQRKKAQDSLEKEKEFLAVTMRSIGDGVIATDIHGRVLFMNRIAETLTGRIQGESIGVPIQEVFHIIDEKSEKPCGDPVAKVLQHGQIVGLNKHTVLVTADGTWRSIADSAAPIHNMQSEIIGVVLVFRDVTDERKMEKEIFKSKKMKSVGILAGGIAHDFNNILGAILGNIDLSCTHIDPGCKALPLLHQAKKAAIRATDLTMQLLTFAKGGEPVKKTASLEELIRDSVGFIIRGSSIACNYQIPNDLMLVDIDTGQIGQVIQNIIINARYAMPEGGLLALRCDNIYDISQEDVVSLKPGRYVKIVVEDDGVGISESIIEKIFDPYFSTKQEGSGLGLAISHSIITQHKGTIQVQSKVGRGTTFTIYLPSSDENAVLTQRKEEQTDKTAYDGISVMVMDDDEMICDIATLQLEHLGCRVITVHNGVDCIARFQEERNKNKVVDVFIMDLTIPGGMGGKEAVQKILAIDSDAKVIVASGYSNDPVMAHYEKYGFIGSIAKPFELVDISKALKTAMQ